VREFNEENGQSVRSEERPKLGWYAEEELITLTEEEHSRLLFSIVLKESRKEGKEQ
jgi:hypothetical protein